MGKSRGILFLALLIAVTGCASGRPDPYGRAVEQYGKGRINESIGDYQQAIRLNPADPHPKFNLAVIYQDEGRLDEAEKLYRSILEQHPGFAPAWSNLASIQEKLGRPDAAEQAYRRAIEADRDDSWTASQFGYFLLRSQRQEEAGKLFEESIRRNAKCANAWYGLALIAEQKGDARTALRDYDRALLYNPSDMQAYLKSANIRVLQGNRGAAIALLRKAVEKDKHRGDIQLWLGRLLAEDGAWKEAEKALEKAKENGAPQGECDRELSIVYEKLSQEAAAKATADNGAVGVQ
jgi:tetratricopeptide (TPR) repeat protein